MLSTEIHFNAAAEEAAIVKPERGVPETIRNQYEENQKHICVRRNTQTDGFKAADYRITWLDLFWTILSIIMRFVSCVLNLKLAYDYYRQKDIVFFWWTLLCISVPTIFTIVFYSIVQRKRAESKRPKYLKQFSRYVLFHLTRNALSLEYAHKCKRAEMNCDRQAQIRYYERVSREESDVALVRLVECFMEVAPQKILLINIAMKQAAPVSTLQWIVIFMYFINSAWCLLVYYRNIRFAQQDKFNISLMGSIMQFFWHLCNTVSRTLIITFLTIISPLVGILVWVLRTLLTGAIIGFYDMVRLGRTNCSNAFICIALGAVYLFAYISISEGSTGSRCCLHYLWSLVEMIVCLTLFMVYAPPALLSERTVEYLCLVVIASHIAGVIFMYLYYTRYHPRITARQKVVAVSSPPVGVPAESSPARDVAVSCPSPERIDARPSPVMNCSLPKDWLAMLQILPAPTTNGN